MKNRIIYIMIALIVVFGGVLAYGMMSGWGNRAENKVDNGNVNDQSVTTPEEEEGTEVPEEEKIGWSSVYVDNNVWDFTVDTTLPNPCYEGKVDVIIAESFPEQVTITYEMIEPSGDMVCTQQLVDFNYEGTFNASESAEVKFKIITDLESVDGDDVDQDSI